MTQPSAAAHLGIDLKEYDARIRTFIPSYVEMLQTAASALTFAGRSPLVVDLGIGTGGLSAGVLAAAPRARIVGVDSDQAMLAVARRRLGSRLTTIAGDFSQVDLPPCDAVTASFSLHHVRARRTKAAIYARAHAALRRGGVLVHADCFLSSDPRRQRLDRTAWRAHLEEAYSRRQSEAFLRAWAKEDVHRTLEVEVAMLGAAGFVVDVLWRRGSFGVLVGTNAQHRRR